MCALRLLLAVVTFAWAALAALPLQAGGALKGTTPSGDFWIVGPWFEDDRTFSHCFAGGDYPDGTNVHFNLRGDSPIQMLLSNAAWSMKIGFRTDVPVTFDGKPPRTVKAMVVNRHSIVFQMDKATFLPELRAARSMAMKTEVTELRFDLHEVGKALDLAYGCYDKRAELPAEPETQFDPFKATVLPVKPPADPNLGGATLQAMLRETGLPEVRVVSPMEQGQSAFRKFNLVWRWQGGEGAYNDTREDVSTTQLIEAVSSALTSACPYQSAFAVLDKDTHGKVRMEEAVFSCNRPKPTVTHFIARSIQDGTDSRVTQLFLFAGNPGEDPSPAARKFARLLAAR